MSYDDAEHEYDDAEAWAWGFIEGMRLCWKDWQPLLSTPQGQTWYKPIALLGEVNYSAEQDTLTRTPAMRADLVQEVLRRSG